MMGKALEEFLSGNPPKGETIELLHEEAWISFDDDFVALDGEFTMDELRKIIAAFEKIVK